MTLDDAFQAAWSASRSTGIRATERLHRKDCGSASPKVWTTAPKSVGPEKESRAITAGPPGDLYIVVKVRPHPVFERKGDNLYETVPITFAEAVLGSRVIVPTMEGETKMTVPEGTQSDQTFRLKGKGMPHLKGGGQGDLYVKVNIVVPKNLNDDSRALIREFDRMNPANPRNEKVRS